MTKLTKGIAIAVILLSIGGLGYLLVSVFGEKKSLPVLGEPGHKAGAFSFQNQEHKTVTEKDVEGKITVVEYFFTTCPGICKVMNSNMSKVFKTYKDEKNFVILSHTVDPENDSVPVLANYADRFDAIQSNWIFLTGDKQKLYNAAREDYLLAAPKQHTTDDFIHTEYVSLLDGHRRIRGFYNATDSASMQKLTQDIGILLETEISN